MVNFKLRVNAGSRFYFDGSVVGMTVEFIRRKEDAKFEEAFAELEC
jgi:hypothetical protein